VPVQEGEEDKGLFQRNQRDCFFP